MTNLTTLLPLILIVLLIIVIVALLAKNSYVKAPPDRAAIISGVTKKPRVLLGKAGFKIPFFERVDWLKVGQIDVDITTENYIPTNDFINIKVDAIAQVAVNCDARTEKLTLDNGKIEETTGMELAMRNFLNKKQEEIRQTIAKSLEGNLREIIGTMTLKNICQNKAQFSAEVKSNAEQDMARLGITILSFNVQNINDKDGLIDNLGMDNRSQIQKDASIAKANAERDIAVAQAEADNAANEAKVRADMEIAKRDNELALKQAELKITEDTKKAEADAAYEIQKQTSRKTLEVKGQEADIAKREKEIELQAKEAEVAEKKLIAEIEKPAEADKFAAMQAADAELYKRQKDAEARLYEEQKDAEAIRAKGEAEAEAIRLKGDAEAEAMDKKAEAMKKYGQAAILEMIVGVLPDMAKAVAEPIAAIDELKIIGSNGDGVTEVAGNVPLLLSKVMESVKEATGIDMKEIVKADTYDAKVNRNVTIQGAVPVETGTESTNGDAQ